MDRLISILRRPDGLYGLISGRTSALGDPTPGADLPAVLDPYTESLLPLAAVPTALLPDRDALLEAWRRLGASRDADSDTLVGAVRILRDTVADPLFAARESESLPPRALRPQRTAAHPRAFRGTKRRLRKPRRRLAPDLQSMICSTSGQARLWRHAEFLRTKAHDPGLARSLPVRVQRTLFWAIRSLGRPGAGRVQAAYWSLGLDRNQPFRRTVSRLLASASAPEFGLAWLGAIEACVPERREHLAELLVESNAVAVQPLPHVLAQLREIDRDSADGVYRPRMLWALRRVAEQVPVDSLVSGYALANRFHPTAELNERWATNQPQRAESIRVGIEDFMARLADPTLGEWQQTRFALSLWERCLVLPGFEQVLALDWSRLDTRSIYRLVDTLASMIFRDWTAPEWDALRAFAPRAVDVLVSLPAKCQSQACRCLVDVIYESPEPEFEARLGRWAQLMPVLAVDAFPRVNSTRPHTQLLKLDDAAWATVLAAPSASFLRLHHSGGRQNDAELTAAGLGSMIEGTPAVVASWFVDAPATLLRTAKSLGTLSPPERARLLRELSEHSLWGEKPAGMGLRQLAERIRASRPPGATNPIRRRLREHFEGKRRLREPQLVAERRRVLAALPSLLLEVLRHRVLVRLGVGIPELPPRSAGARHALMMQRFARSNRRSLREVLRRYATGDRYYLWRHPTNARWLAERLPAPEKRVRWLNGVRLTRETPSGRVTLQVERDPLEALRLGTYVGSCLGLGGDLARSAVAVVLDANKQVVYARRQGRVVGRQIVALSDDRRLVCYQVYGDQDLEPLFKEYDLALAAALDVLIHSDDDDDDGAPTIPVLVASWWWDDGAWDVLGSAADVAT